MGLLEKIYELLKFDEPIDDIHIPHSAVFYAKRLISDNLGLDVDLYELEDVMREEGLLPAREYGVPRWYWRKYQML